MEGRYYRVDKSYQGRVCVRPIEKHYDVDCEPPIIKFCCPVCEQFGSKHSLADGTPTCPICGVNLLWNEISVK